MIGTAVPNMAATNMILPTEPLVFYTMSPPPTASVITASSLPQAPTSVIPMVASAPTLGAAATGLTSPFVTTIPVRIVN